MLKNKNLKQIKINSEDLFKISIKLLNKYNLETNFYFILLLCYLTVKEFSRNNEHLDKTAKIDLSIKYIPDLIDGLLQSKIITDVEYKEIKKELDRNEKDLVDIFNVYTIISSINNNDVIKKTKCCLT